MKFMFYKYVEEVLSGKKNKEIYCYPLEISGIDKMKLTYSLVNSAYKYKSFPIIFIFVKPEKHDSPAIRRGLEVFGRIPPVNFLFFISDKNYAHYTFYKIIGSSPKIVKDVVNSLEEVEFIKIEKSEYNWVRRYFQEEASLYVRAIEEFMNENNLSIVDKKKDRYSLIYGDVSIQISKLELWQELLRKMEELRWKESPIH